MGMVVLALLWPVLMAVSFCPPLYIAVFMWALGCFPMEDEPRKPVKPAWFRGQYEEGWVMVMEQLMGAYILFLMIGFCCGVGSRLHSIAVVCLALLVAATNLFAMAPPGSIFYPLLIILAVETCFAVMPHILFTDRRMFVELGSVQVDLYSPGGKHACRLDMLPEATIGDLKRLVAGIRNCDIETVSIIHGMVTATDYHPLRHFLGHAGPNSIVFNLVVLEQIEP